MLFEDGGFVDCDFELFVGGDCEVKGGVVDVYFPVCVWELGWCCELEVY